MLFIYNSNCFVRAHMCVLHTEFCIVFAMALQDTVMTHASSCTYFERLFVFVQCREGIDFETHGCLPPYATSSACRYFQAFF